MFYQSQKNIQSWSVRLVPYFLLQRHNTVYFPEVSFCNRRENVKQENLKKTKFSHNTIPGTMLWYYVLPK